MTHTSIHDFVAPYDDTYIEFIEIETARMTGLLVFKRYRGRAELKRLSQHHDATVARLAVEAIRVGRITDDVFPHTKAFQRAARVAAGVSRKERGCYPVKLVDGDQPPTCEG